MSRRTSRTTGVGRTTGRPISAAAPSPSRPALVKPARPGTSGRRQPAAPTTSSNQAAERRDIGNLGMYHGATEFTERQPLVVDDPDWYAGQREEPATGRASQLSTPHLSGRHGWFEAEYGTAAKPATPLPASARKRLTDAAREKARRGGALEQERNARVMERIAKEGLFKFKNLRDMFRSMDTNGSGCIDSAEFEAYCEKNNFDAVIPRAELWGAFVAADRDGDDSVNFAEFVGTMKKLNPLKRMHITARRTPADQNRVWKRKAELQNLLHMALKKKQGGREERQDGQLLWSAFKRFDADNSGELSYDEFARALGPNVLGLDLRDADLRDLCLCLDGNGDGSISVPEMFKAMDIDDAVTKPDLDMLEEGRRRELRVLAHAVKQPWTEDAEEMRLAGEHVIDTSQTAWGSDAGTERRARTAGLAARLEEQASWSKWDFKTKPSRGELGAFLPTDPSPRQTAATGRTASSWQELTGPRTVALPARKEVTAEYSHMSGPCLFAGAGHRTSGMYVAPADRFTTTSSLFFETPRAANGAIVARSDKHKKERAFNATMDRHHRHGAAIKRMIDVTKAKENMHACGRVNARSKAKLRYVHEIESNMRPLKDPFRQHAGDSRMYKSQGWFKQQKPGEAPL
jgi:Ca2+-binding EF-hand superfamily protein